MSALEIILYVGLGIIALWFVISTIIDIVKHHKLAKEGYTKEEIKKIMKQKKKHKKEEDEE